MEDRGSSLSVLVSQVDSVSLVQLSRYRGSRASVLLPPQPITLHQGAFDFPAGWFFPLADNSGFQKKTQKKTE